mmetsp:Transcript_81160/g.211774  ORF Transcript_81160/g.211774 Transcript_81160/m.211774 type:complete len:298 (+) Transcript_81160:205-1098(+)
MNAAELSSGSTARTGSGQVSCDFLLGDNDNIVGLAVAARPEVGRYHAARLTKGTHPVLRELFRSSLGTPNALGGLGSLDPWYRSVCDVSTEETADCSDGRCPMILLCKLPIAYVWIKFSDEEASQHKSFWKNSSSLWSWLPPLASLGFWKSIFSQIVMTSSNFALVIIICTPPNSAGTLRQTGAGGWPVTLPFLRKSRHFRLPNADVSLDFAEVPCVPPKRSSFNGALFSIPKSSDPKVISLLSSFSGSAFRGGLISRTHRCSASDFGIHTHSRLMYVMPSVASPCSSPSPRPATGT